MTRDPMTTAEDRVALWRCAKVAGAVILLFAMIGLARAEPEEDGGPMRAGMQAYANAGPSRGGRPAGCPGQWCGCWASIKVTGKNDRKLWAARNWPNDKRFRRVPAPAPGVIAVFARGKKGGHVGIVTAVPKPGTIILLSGNDGNAVRERERTTAGVIAYLQYVGA